MTLRTIVGVDLNNAVACPCEHVFGFIVDQSPRIIKMKVENVRFYGNSKVVDISFTGDVNFVRNISYEHKEIKVTVTGNTMFNENAAGQATHILQPMQQRAINPNPRTKVITDFEIKNAVTNESHHLLYIWD